MIMAQHQELEHLEDVNGNAIIAGDRLLVLSERHPKPFYVVIYRNADGKLCIELDGKEESISHMLEHVWDIELVIPLFEYEFED